MALLTLEQYRTVRQPRQVFNVTSSSETAVNPRRGEVQAKHVLQVSSRCSESTTSSHGSRIAMTSSPSGISAVAYRPTWPGSASHGRISALPSAFGDAIMMLLRRAVREMKRTRTSFRQETRIRQTLSCHPNVKGASRLN